MSMAKVASSVLELELVGAVVVAAVVEVAVLSAMVVEVSGIEDGAGGGPTLVVLGGSGTDFFSSEKLSRN